MSREVVLAISAVSAIYLACAISAFSDPAQENDLVTTRLASLRDASRWRITYGFSATDYRHRLYRFVFAAYRRLLICLDVRAVGRPTDPDRFSRRHRHSDWVHASGCFRAALRLGQSDKVNASKRLTLLLCLGPDIACADAGIF